MIRDRLRVSAKEEKKSLLVLLSRLFLLFRELPLQLQYGTVKQTTQRVRNRTSCFFFPSSVLLQITFSTTKGEETEAPLDKRDADAMHFYDT